MRVLLVDDDVGVRTTLFELFKDKYELEQCESGEQALLQLEKALWDLVLTDNKMTGISGIELIKKGKILAPSTSFILLTAHASIEQAVEAIKLGADDYVMKPFELIEMEHRVSRVENFREWKNQNVLKTESKIGLSRLVGKSKNLEDAKAFIEKVKDVPSSILILGPTGSGKEVLAQAIHESSERNKSSFVAINCASLTEQLMESELFGHEKGAFTGATSSKPGKFELANGGTIFLDEIGELSLDLQAKLLRVLEEKEFYRIGGLKTIRSTARVVAATNRDLKKLTQEGQFREDLFFRLNVLTFHTLALEERKDDIIPLIEFFWKSLTQELHRKSKLSEELRHALENYHFPGNIRELKNILERLIVLGPLDGEVGPETLPHEIFVTKTESETASNFNPVNEISLSAGLTLAIERFELQVLEKALAESGNNQIKAAALLKIPRGTLQYKLKKLQIKKAT